MTQSKASTNVLCIVNRFSDSKSIENYTSAAKDIDFWSL